MPIPFFVKRAKGLSYKTSKRANFIARTIHSIMIRKAGFVWNHIGTHIYGKKVLDIGMGSGSITYFLKKKGYDVTSIDVDNLSIYKDLEPVVYDGHKMPFKANQFDTAVIIHVLHHCDDGLEILKEAKRVAKKVVVIEDTYRNKWEKFWISVFDNLGNFEFWWHKYRTIMEWKRIIKNNNWKVGFIEEWSEIGVANFYGRYVMFVIE